MKETLFPFRPGDWVMDQSGRVARVKSIDFIADEFTFDLVMYSRTGERIGRASPACGGPRTFEPCCSLDGWERCVEPDFPLSLQWVTEADGARVAKYWAKRLPSANWRKPARGSTSARAVLQNERFRRALERIALGDNDARKTAAEALGLGPAK